MIYTTFKQWVKGRFLEIGEPRKQAYSKDELALVEMGWGYGYDAGVQWQKSQQALDKMAENARELGLDYEPQPQREWVGLTDDDWDQIWDEFDGLDIENDFQDQMVAKHGDGYYTDPDGYWEFQKQVIQRMVNDKLKEKNT